MNLSEKSKSVLNGIKNKIVESENKRKLELYTSQKETLDKYITEVKDFYEKYGYKSDDEVIKWMHDNPNNNVNAFHMSIATYNKDADEIVYQRAHGCGWSVTVMDLHLTDEEFIREIDGSSTYLDDKDMVNSLGYLRFVNHFSENVFPDYDALLEELAKLENGHMYVNTNSPFEEYV